MNCRGLPASHRPRVCRQPSPRWTQTLRGDRVSAKVHPGERGQVQERGASALNPMEMGRGDPGTGPAVGQLPQPALRVPQPCSCGKVMPFNPQQDLLCARPTLSPSEVPDPPRGPAAVPWDRWLPLTTSLLGVWG